MSDPTKYYEAQSSGAKYIIGNRGEERFGESKNEDGSIKE